MSAGSAEIENNHLLRFGDRKDESSNEHDLTPLLSCQMGRVEDYLPRAGMYIGNLQKSADYLPVRIASFTHLYW